MKTNCLYLSIAIILSLYSNTDSVLIDRLVNRNESGDCPTLCDNDIHIDAITGINLTPELLLVSGDCAFIVDPRLPQANQKRHGFKHLLPFSEIQDMFAIGNKTDIEFVSVYASGTLVDVISANSTVAETNFTGSNVFEGLSVDIKVPIDAAFAWSDNRIVYLIQGSKYWAYSMSRGWKKGGQPLDNYPRNITDFGLKSDHKITSAFINSTKIYFLSLDLVYIYEISSIDSRTGIFKGSLSQKSIKLNDFLNCPKVVKKCKSVKNLLKFLAVIPKVFDQYFNMIWLVIALIFLSCSLFFLMFSTIKYHELMSFVRTPSPSKV